MRFFDLTASAIAAALLLHGAVASEQPVGYAAPPVPPVGYDAPPAPPPYSAPAGHPAPPEVTPAVTTYYTTLTVFRVETTVTATRNGTRTALPTTLTETSTAIETSTIVPTTLASATIPTYGNTTSVYSPGVPTGIITSTGAASGLKACAMAVAAVAGVASLLML